MQHLDFILWTCLFPVSLSLSSYLDEKTNKIIGRTKEYRELSRNIQSFIYFIVWVYIGVKLYGPI